MWNTETQRSEFDAQSFINKQIDGRAGVRGGVLGNIGTSANGVPGVGGVSFGIGGINLSAFSIVGMDITKVQPAIDAIDTYVLALENHIEAIDPLAQSTEAFKGETLDTSMIKYVQKVKDYCMNLASQLRAFQDKLVDAQNAWKASVNKISETIDQSTGSYSTGEKYSRQVSAN